nr:DNA primase regulatory subunit PriL [Methanosarcina sp. UBA5]
MDEEHIALYPFASEVSVYVESLGVSLESLLNSSALRKSRVRGMERVMQSIEGEIEKPLIKDESWLLSETLSYPFAQILVACLDDQLFTKRYALKEAEAASKWLEKESTDFLLEFGEDFGIQAEAEELQFSMHFADYIRFSSSIREPIWKLTNRQLRSGMVVVAKKDLVRLLQEAIKERIEKSFPVPKIPSEVSSFCTPYVAEIKDKFEIHKKKFGTTDFGEVEPELFPPCISHALANVQGGVNLAHSMRFAMTSFLLSVGMSVDEILNLFNVSPDFDAEITLYQIEHIAGATGNVYKPPACDTMRTYGNCIGKDRLCEKISHPLAYYEKKIYLKNKEKEKEKEKEEGKEKQEEKEGEKGKERKEGKGRKEKKER